MPGITKRIRVTGPNAAEVVDLASPRIGSSVADKFSLEILSGDEQGDCDCCFTISDYDTPEFAAEKLIDFIAEHGWLRISELGMSAAEEAALRSRLVDLGYLE